jgi:predicted ester cyclase
MFGDRFPVASAPAAPSPLTVEAAQRIVQPLYDALNQPQKKDVAALLTQACHTDYRSYSTNEEWLTREQLADVFKQLGACIPDLRWDIKEIWTAGNRIVVRGEATGTPVDDLFGARPTGRSFKTMALDIFTVRDDKLASACHVENWVGAMQQIR